MVDFELFNIGTTDFPVWTGVEGLKLFEEAIKEAYNNSILKDKLKQNKPYKKYGKRNKRK